MAPSRAADDRVAPGLSKAAQQTLEERVRDSNTDQPPRSRTAHTATAQQSDVQAPQMSCQTQHTNHERAFARYQDSEPSGASDDELDTVPLSVYRDRIIGRPRKPTTSTPLENTPDAPQEQARLIDRVTNQWRNRPAYHDSTEHTDDEDDTFFSGSDYQQDLEYWKKKGAAWVPGRAQRVAKPVKRVALICFCTAVIIWALFTFCLHPWLTEHAFWDRVYSHAQLASKNDGMARYGTQKELAFDNTIQVKTLDREHLPHGRRPGRLVFVGDVHGCKRELVRLLAKLSFDERRDHLVLTGDMVNKGPDTPGVVDLVRSLGASCVRGNHEDKVLLLREELARHGTLLEEEQQQQQQQQEQQQHLPASEARALATARQLSRAQAAWLQACPVILRVGSVHGVGNVVAVHAGLAPGVPLAKQDPFQVMNMRTMDPETRVPSEGRELERWDKVWAEWQERADSKDRTVVVYGHDSKRGLNVKGKWAKGLDSGCVNGGKLTALVLDAEGRQEIVQVKCSADNRG